jgi:hypothetical protein
LRECSDERPTPISRGLLLVWALLLGCAPMEYKEVGRLLDQKRAMVRNFQIQINLHEIKGYDERQLYVWCQTEKTVALQSTRRFADSQAKANIQGPGWSLVGYDTVGIDKIKDDYMAKYVNAVDDNILFMGIWNASLTLDGCASVVHVYSDVVFDKWLKSGEIVRASSDRDARAFFRKFSNGVDGGCLEVDPAYIRANHAGFRACTLNAGKTWEASRVGKA